MASNGLSFRLGGIPIKIAPSVLFVLGVLAIFGQDTTGPRVAVFVSIGVVSILLHEFGHATAAAMFGGKPTIELRGMGGLTAPGFTTAVGRRRTAIVIMAGPGAGLFAGALVWLIAQPDTFWPRVDDDLATYAISIALWMNIGWSLANLLPVLPLDGGRLVVEALPGDEFTRTRRGYLISGITGVVAGVAMFFIGFLFGPVLFAMLATQSFGNWRRMSRFRSQRNIAAEVSALQQRLMVGDSTAIKPLEAFTNEPQIGPVVRSMLAEHHARLGDQSAARSILGHAADNMPSATFLVETLASQGERGVDSLIEAFRRAPSPLAARHLVIGLDSSGRLADLPGLLRSVGVGQPSPVPNVLGVMASAQATAHELGLYEVAVDLAATAYEREPNADGLIAFNAACSLAKLGQHDLAVQWLQSAVQRGLPDISLIDSDDDLAALRGLPAFRALQAPERP